MSRQPGNPCFGVAENLIPKIIVLSEMSRILIRVTLIFYLDNSDRMAEYNPYETHPGPNSS
jgi:hypothetical protein